MKKSLPSVIVAAVAVAGVLLLAGCNPMLRGIYPDQTANSVTFQISTNDPNVTNWSTQQVMASIYESDSSYPLVTLSSGLSYSSASASYTARLTFTGLQDDTFYALVWLDLNGDGVWDNNESYYLSPDFALYGAQSVTTPVNLQ